MWQKLGRLIQHNLELIFWLVALIGLYQMSVETAHFSLCPLAAAGYSWCPGCGLGHSLHYAMHLDFHRAWQEHYFGIFALLLILYRIFQLLKVNYQLQKPKHGRENFQNDPRH